MTANSRYRLIEKLTRGGMAEIYLGRREGEDQFQRVCCIKRILPHYSQEKEYIEMFRDEAHICKRLQHPNIVKVEGFEEIDGSYAIIMDYVEGADLRKVLVACENAGRPIQIPMAIYIAAEIAKGLYYAHTKIDDVTQKPLEIVHRDVSPQNILISFEGDVKITDFGIADAKSKSTETKPGIVKGKYSYMSPEQIMAKPVTGQTDVFALGIILWEMVAMERLFHSDNDVITIQKVRNCEIKKLPRTKKRQEGEVDDLLEKIIMKALQKDTKKRYKDAKQFERVLREYLNSRFPAFSSHDLSIFMKEILKEQRTKLQSSIKKALTATNLKPVSSNAPTMVLSNQPNLSQSQINLAPSALAPHNGGTGFGASARAMPPTSRHPNSHSRVVNLNHTNVGSNGTPSSNFARRQIIHKNISKKRKSAPRLILTMLIALLAIGTASYATKRFLLGRNAPIQLMIRTTPSTVKISVNGKIQNNSRYLTTPFKQKLKPGKHLISVFRNGFKPETINVTAKSGRRQQKLDVVLQKNAKMAPVKVIIGNRSVAKVWVDTDAGLDTGYAPRKIDDLTYGKVHQMVVYPNYPQLSKRYTCSFRPRSMGWMAPFTIIIYPKNRKCVYSAP